MITNLNLSSVEAKHKVFPSIDIAKFVCAVLVVAIHTTPLIDINVHLDNALCSYLTRLAVPFFFITAGYFCFRKTSYSEFDFHIPFRQALKILKLYLLWTVIYFIPLLYRDVYNCEEGYLWGLLYAVRTVIFSGYHHLWYLNATAFSIIAISIAIKKKFHIKTILLWGFLLYLIGLFGQSYYFLIKPLSNYPILWSFLQIFRKIIATTRNGLFEGVLFVSIGMLFAYKKIVLKYTHALIGFIISMLLLFVEVFIIIYQDLFLEKNTYLFLAPAAFFMFYLISHIEIPISPFTGKLRTYSTLVYFVHSWINTPILTAVILVLNRLLNTDYTLHSFLRFLVVLGTSIFISWIIMKLENLKHWKWLKKLY